MNTSFREMSAESLPISILNGAPGSAALSDFVEAHRVERPAGTIEKLEGDTCSEVYFVISGWLAASKSLADGQRQVVDIVLDGGMLDPASSGSDKSAVEIEFLTRTVFAPLPRESWLRMLSLDPGLRRALLGEREAIMARMFERMLRLGKGSAENRIAYALCELCLRSSDAGLRERRAYPIPLNQPLLGDFCGLSSVHVCRTLRRLEIDGIVERTNRMDIVIHKLDALAEIAQIDPEALRGQIVSAAAPEFVTACDGRAPQRRAAAS